MSLFYSQIWRCILFDTLRYKHNALWAFLMVEDHTVPFSNQCLCRVIYCRELSQWHSYIYVIFFFISGNTSSENYDVTLMICLLRNFSTIVPPSNGYDKMPPATEISDGADLARIKYYRNQIVHAEKDEISKQDFTIAWACVSKVNMSCKVLVKWS